MVGVDNEPLGIVSLGEALAKAEEIDIESLTKELHRDAADEGSGVRLLTDFKRGVPSVCPGF